MFNLVLFGPPGSGKGTQSVRLADKYHLIHLSTGDMLRREIAHETPLGKAAKEIMDRGELVSDEIVIGMIDSQIENNPEAHGFIFDGFPRTTVQAMALDNLLAKYGSKINITLSLEVDNEELVKRLLQRGKDSGREDDRNETVIANRIKEYQNKTAPLIDYYRASGKYRSVWGMEGIDKVFHLLCDEIDKSGHNKPSVNWNESVETFKEEIPTKTETKAPVKQKAIRARQVTLKTVKAKKVIKQSKKTAVQKSVVKKKSTSKTTPKAKKSNSNKTVKKAVKNSIKSQKKSPLRKIVKAAKKKQVKPVTRKKVNIVSKNQKGKLLKKGKSRKTTPVKAKKSVKKPKSKNVNKKSVKSKRK